MEFRGELSRNNCLIFIKCLEYKLSSGSTLDVRKAVKKADFKKYSNESEARVSGRGRQVSRRKLDHPYRILKKVAE